MMLLTILQAADSSATYIDRRLTYYSAIALFVVSMILLILFVRAMRQEAPRIETHWGGFGGGMGGWRISPSMAYLIVAIVFAALFMTVIRQDVKAPEPDKTASPAARDSSTGQPQKRDSSQAAGSQRPPGWVDPDTMGT